MQRHHAHLPVAAPAISQAAGALDAFCASERLPDEVAWRLRVALDEIVTNVVAHGSPGQAASIDVWFSRKEGFVEIRVADDGPAFNPLARTEPDTTSPLESRQPGGLGIALVKALMDDVQYERTTRNILTIRKRIDTAPSGGGAGADEHPTSQA